MTLGAVMRTFGPSIRSRLGAMVVVPGKLGGLSEVWFWLSEAKRPVDPPSQDGIPPSGRPV